IAPIATTPRDGLAHLKVGWFVYLNSTTAVACDANGAARSVRGKDLNRQHHTICCSAWAANNKRRGTICGDRHGAMHTKYSRRRRCHHTRIGSCRDGNCATTTLQLSGLKRHLLNRTDGDGRTVDERTTRRKRGSVVNYYAWVTSCRALKHGRSGSYGHVTRRNRANCIDMAN